MTKTKERITRAQIREAVKMAVSKVLGIPWATGSKDLSTVSLPDDLDLTGHPILAGDLDIVEIVMTLEELFGIEINHEDIGGYEIARNISISQNLNLSKNGSI